VTHPRDLTPTARALFWYLMATGWKPVEVRTACLQSGIPDKSLYEAIRRFPETFILRGSVVEGRTTIAEVLLLQSRDTQRA
jgi:hypothetical protein